MININRILTNLRPEVDFNSSDDFILDGLLDSFDIMVLVSDLDKEYSISIDGSEIVPENFKNQYTIKELLRQHGVEP